jgi:cytochrome c peroxidase
VPRFSQCRQSLRIGATHHRCQRPRQLVGRQVSPGDYFAEQATHEIKRTTDPGRALITGLWKDVGRLKGPVLRGLASRAPYFHNGSADSLDDVLDFYNKRFNIGLTPQEKKDLIAFLNTL